MKQKTPRDHKYLAWIRKQDCCVCQVKPEVRQIQAAHVRFLGGGGTSLKPSDYQVVPMCATCHTSQHNMSEINWWGSKEAAQGQIIKALIGYIAHRESLMDVVKVLSNHIEEQR